MKPFNPDRLSSVSASHSSDPTEDAHLAVQESYEVGSHDDFSEFEEEADHGISRMMGEGGVAPPESPHWQRWASMRQPEEGDTEGKLSD